MPHPRPVFGYSNKRDGRLAILDDGTVLHFDFSQQEWIEGAPMPRTARHAELCGAPRADRRATDLVSSFTPTETPA